MTRDTFKAKGTPPPAAAEPKTLPVPTRVYLTDKAAVIVGYPQRGWDEEGPDAHNCDDMGCPTFGRHVLARVPFTDERAEQPAAPSGERGDEMNIAALPSAVAHEIWAAAQLAPGEGIVDGAARVEALLSRYPLYSQQSIEALRAEAEKLRALAACAYQMAGMHDAPLVWLDRLSEAANDDALPDVDTLMDELLPYQPDAVCEAEAENKRLRAEVEDYRTNGAAAVRFAPSSAYWTNELRRLFGDEARNGIEILESRYRQELTRAERLAEVLALLPDDSGMIEHSPEEGPFMFCCGREVTYDRLHGPICIHDEECWYARMRALRDHDQEEGE